MTQIDALKTDEIQNYEIEHQEEVRRLAGECIVILENDGVLPLQAGTKKIALFGTGARHTIKGGTGSGDVNVRENISIAQGLERAGFKFVTEGWLDQYDRLYADAQEAMEQQAKENTEMLSQAKARAKTLIEEYIKNVGESIGEEYTVEWKDAEPGMTKSEKK